jgi:hypothetical protein
MPRRHDLSFSGRQFALESSRQITRSFKRQCWPPVKTNIVSLPPHPSLLHHLSCRKPWPTAQRADTCHWAAHSPQPWPTAQLPHGPTCQAATCQPMASPMPRSRIVAFASRFQRFLGSIPRLRGRVDLVRASASIHGFSILPLPNQLALSKPLVKAMDSPRKGIDCPA